MPGSFCNSSGLHGNVPPWSRQHGLRGSLQVEGAAIIAQPGPGPDHVARRCRCQGFERWELRQKRMILWDDPIDLRLLQHDLGNQDVVWVAGPTPGKIAGMCGVPFEQRRPNGR